MKNNAIYLIFLLLVVSSCKKTGLSTNESLVGKWNWVYTWQDAPEGPDNPYTPLNTGVGELLILNSDFTWSKHLSGQTIYAGIMKGTYSVGHGKYTPYKGADPYIYDSIIYYMDDVNPPISVDYFKVLSDTLIFSSGFRGMAGGGSKTYVKHTD